MIGQTISHYKIVEELGRGGMGVVYKAEDTKLNRTVALKFLSPHLLADEQQTKRFLREAQAAAALDHPNISTIHEVHESDGQTFMVMAYIEGEDLGKKIESGPMDIEEALDIAVQVARGLSKAHGEGIVHRDIKPGNVLITPESQAKIVDFGLAKLATQTRLTKSGAAVGTVRYMSPEQATGGEVDHHTDIWSVGVMLYEMLTGRLPFRGDVEHAVVYSILNEEPQPVTSTRKDVPLALEDIIKKALEKDQAKRYETVDELLSELETQRDHITLGIKERRFTALRKLRRRKRLTLGVATVVVVALAAILTQTFYKRSMAIDSVAVLPFANLSGDAEQEYFADGMTEALINELGQIGALRVISRTSVMQFKETNKALPEIAQELNVDAVVEASVLRSGDQIRITAQLIRANPERQLWAKDYERSVKDVLALHSELARTIAGQIRVALTPQEEAHFARPQDVDPEAYEAYLKGRDFAALWSKEGYATGLEYFEKAIEIDPTYAPAYVGLADCHVGASLMAFVPPHESAASARAAVEKALELDNTLGEAYTMRAWLKYSYDWDEIGPDEDFRRGIELSPNSALAHEWYSQYLGMIGRGDEAIAESKRALELDPLSQQKQEGVVRSSVLAGRYDEAVARIKKVQVQTKDPNYGLGWLAMIYASRGMINEAIAMADSAMPFLERSQVILGTAGQFYAAVGRTGDARKLLDELMALSEDQWIDPYYVALIYSGLGEWDNAMDWLERGYRERSPSMLWARGWSPPEGSHYQERYEKLLSKIFTPVD